MSDIREGDRVGFGDFYGVVEGTVNRIYGNIVEVGLDNGKAKLVYLRDCVRLTPVFKAGGIIEGGKLETNSPSSNECSCGAKHTNNPKFHLSYCNKA